MQAVCLIELAAIAEVSVLGCRTGQLPVAAHREVDARTSQTASAGRRWHQHRQGGDCTGVQVSTCLDDDDEQSHQLNQCTVAQKMIEIITAEQVNNESTHFGGDVVVLIMR